MQSLRTRFLFAEEDFLKAHASDSYALQLFGRTWSDLLQDFESSLQEMDVDTLKLAHGTASRLAAIATTSLQIQERADQLSTELLSDLDRIFAQLSVEDFAATPCTFDKATPSDTSTTFSSPKFPFIGPAYQWLLQNLHNPYPSKEIRARIANDANCSLRKVNAWFISVRRRIGWTSLCAKHFHRSRAHTIAAAYRVLVNSGSKPPVANEIRMAFFEVEAAAKELYFICKTTNSDELEGLVRATVQEGAISDQEPTATSEEKKLIEAKPAKHMGCSPPDESLLCATPISALSPADDEKPCTLLDGEEDVEDTTPSAPVAGRKRPLSFCENSDYQSQGDRPTKRKRSSNMLVADFPLPSTASCFPSLTSTCPFTFDSQTSTPSSPSPPALTALFGQNSPSTAPRKRRLSDVDLVSFPRRPCGVDVRLRPYAVSDPLPKPMPLPVDTNDWFKELLETPAFAIIGGPDQSQVSDLIYDPLQSEAPVLNLDDFNFGDRADSSSDSSPAALQTPIEIALDVSEFPTFNASCSGLLSSYFDPYAFDRDLLSFEDGWAPVFTSDDTLPCLNKLPLAYEQGEGKFVNREPLGNLYDDYPELQKADQELLAPISF